MNCEEFERGWQELEDPSEVSPHLEKHCQECPACAEMAHDLQTIVQQARQMLPLENPPEAMWRQIRQQLESERVIRGIPQRRFPASVPVLGWWQRLRLPTGLAYAAYATVFLLAMGVVYLQHNVSTNTSVPQKTAVDLAKVPYPAGDEAFRQLVDKIPAEKRATYVTQFDRVNSSIEQLTTFAQEHPGDPFAQGQLFNAYEHRERLWETMVKWEEF